MNEFYPLKKAYQNNITNAFNIVYNKINYFSYLGLSALLYDPLILCQTKFKAIKDVTLADNSISY